VNVPPVSTPTVRVLLEVLVAKGRQCTGTVERGKTGLLRDPLGPPRYALAFRAMPLAALDSFPATPAGFGAVAVAYLLGSIPPGLLIARAKGIDLRQVGSGNIGATNTVRALGRFWGVLAFLLDFAKGWVPVALIAPRVVAADDALAQSFAHLLRPVADQAVPGVAALQVACGAAAVVGHCFPIYLRFRGGKGVATGCGAIVGIDPLVFVLSGLVWLATAALGRMVGLASLAMGLAFPLFMWWRHPGQATFILGAGLLTLLIVVRHRSNIARMLAGTEPRLGSR